MKYIDTPLTRRLAAQIKALRKQCDALQWMPELGDERECHGELDSLEDQLRQIDPNHPALKKGVDGAPQR